MACQVTIVTDEQAEVKPAVEMSSDPSCPGANAAPRDGKVTSFNSMGELMKEAPELYQKILEGIGLEICREMREHQARMKKIIRENAHH